MNDDFIIKIKSYEKEIIISINDKHLDRLIYELSDWFIDHKIDANVIINVNKGNKEEQTERAK